MSGCGTCLMSTAHIADPPVPKRAYPTRKRNEERFDPGAFFSPSASVFASNGAARRCVTRNAPLSPAAFALKNSPKDNALSGLSSAIFSGRARRSTVQNATRPVASPEARRKFRGVSFPSADQRKALTPLLPACVTASSAHRRSRGDQIFNAPSSYATARSGFVGCHASAATETPPRSSGTASGRRWSKGSPSSVRREARRRVSRQTCVSRATRRTSSLEFRVARFVTKRTRKEGTGVVRVGAAAGEDETSRTESRDDPSATLEVNAVDGAASENAVARVPATYPCTRRRSRPRARRRPAARR